MPGSYTTVYSVMASCKNGSLLSTNVNAFTLLQFVGFDPAQLIAQDADVHCMHVTGK